MFKKHALQVSVVKEPKKQDTASSTVVSHLHVEPEQISKIVTDQVMNAALVFMSVYAVKVTIDTCSQIAINLTTKI